MDLAAAGVFFAAQGPRLRLCEGPARKSGPQGFVYGHVHAPAQLGMSDEHEAAQARHFRSDVPNQGGAIALDAQPVISAVVPVGVSRFSARVIELGLAK